MLCRNQKNISLNDSNFSSPTTGMLNMSSSFGSPSRHKSDVSSTSRNRSKISLNDSSCSIQMKRMLCRNQKNISLNDSNFSSPTTGMLNMSSSFGSPSRHKSD